MQLLDDLYFFPFLPFGREHGYIYKRLSDIYTYKENERERETRCCRSLLIEISLLSLIFLFSTNRSFEFKVNLKVSELIDCIDLISTLLFSCQRDLMIICEGETCVFFFSFSFSFDVTGEKEKEERADGHDERANRKLMHNRWKQKHRPTTRLFFYSLLSTSSIAFRLPCSIEECF